MDHEINCVLSITFIFDSCKAEYIRGSDNSNYNKEVNEAVKVESRKGICDINPFPILKPGLKLVRITLEINIHDMVIAYLTDQRSKDTITNVVPNPTYNFDPTKCSDSIAISSSVDGPCANQRASKVWGTVLSMKHFNPKSGIHRWALRIDKCERGHVFFGVATSQASTKTYVGGDKYGWGVIGTQALWHNRSKIRGDYGSIFRTGATIVVTLDTDAGTLSFGLWKQGHDDQNSSTQTIHLSSPSRSATTSLHENTFEDWGIAFEGLPLDTRLFPAVGLYQRDDKVSILSIETNNDSGDQKEITHTI